MALGEHDISVREGPERFYTISRTVTHPNYRKIRGKAQYDFRLLELTEDVELSKEISPACLPRDARDKYEDQRAIVSGWGALEVAGRLPNKLQYANVRVHEQCGDYVDIKAHHICASGRNDNDEITDTCQGDSGGECNGLDEHFNQMRARSRHARQKLFTCDLTVQS